jgi:hypothetical protein
LLLEFNDEPQNQHWYWQGSRLTVNNKRQLQQQFSTVLEKIYDQAPVLFNELINKDKPSAQAVSARNKLLQAMLNHSDKPDLGFDSKTFPPEKSIYRAILWKSQIHSQSDKQQWGFDPFNDNNSINDPSNMKPVWQQMVEFIESTETEARSFVELDKILVAPPYGVKAGLLPILYIAVYFAHQHDIALYEKRVYRPYIDSEMIDRFVKKRDNFTIQKFKIEGLNKSIFSQYNQALFGVSGTTDNHGKQRTLLDLAKPLTKFMNTLPLCTQKTNRLSTKATALRRAFNLSKSPVKLMFEDIPKALNVKQLENTNINDVEKLSKNLTNTLKEIKYFYPGLIKKQHNLFAQIFGYSENIKLDELRNNIAESIAGLESYTVETSDVIIFIMHLIDTKNNDQKWLENILTFLGCKTTDKWLDSDQNHAEYRLNIFVQKINDMEKLRYQFENNHNEDDSDIALLTCNKNGSKQFEEVITISKKQKEEMKNSLSVLAKTLNEVQGKEFQLGVLAEVVNDFLTEYKELSNTKNNPESVI